MSEAYSTTTFDQLSVGLPPPTVSPHKPETEVNSAVTSDQGKIPRRDLFRAAGSARRRRRHGGPPLTSSSEFRAFVGYIQQLSVDGRELFELAEQGHFDVVDSTATKDVSGGPITFTSPEAYLSLTSETQSSTFSVYFRVRSRIHVCWVRLSMYRVIR